MELEQRIKNEIEENPALEEGAEQELDEYDEPADDMDDVKENDDLDIDLSDYFDEDTPDYKTQVNNRSKDDEDRVIPLSGESSFRERLIDQLQLLDLTETEFIIADTLVGNLDEAGYLGRDLEAIVDDLAFSMNVITDLREVEGVLEIIQDLDPAGIGARSLRECLLLQIKRKEKGNITIYTAKVILRDFFEEFTKKHYDKILKKLEIEEEDLKDALDEITKLNPKPGGASKEAARNNQQINPDFIVNEFEGKLELTLNGKNAPDLKVNKMYETMLRNYSDGAKTSKSDKEALLFVKQKLDSAKWFIDAIKQRQETLFMTMQAIMHYQKEYFLTGDEGNLKPMILKDVAEVVGLDVSTISRVSNSKYVQTNFGIFPLKYFFSESMSSDSGEEVSTRKIKKIITDSIDVEDKRKPLTDEQLMDLLKTQGFTIARRTVAKYREQLDIPVARLRKEL